jgi:hypothetical protein
MDETRASRPVLYLAWIGTSLAILLLAWYTLLTAPETFVVMVATIILAWVVEGIWRWISKREVKAVDAERGS